MNDFEKGARFIVALAIVLLCWGYGLYHIHQLHDDPQNLYHAVCALILLSGGIKLGSD